MRRSSTRVASLLLAATLTVAVTGCGGGQATSASQEVRSADGSAILSIPDGALPANLKASDIKITQLSPGDSGVQIDGQPPTAAYRFDPDGAQFKKPLSFQMTVPNGQAGFAQAFLVPTGAPPIQLDTATDLGDGSGPATVTVSVPHFSQVFVDADGGVDKLTTRLTLKAPDTAIVGAPFVATAITLWGGSYSQSQVVWRGVTWTWRFTPTTFHGQFAASSGLTPTTVKGAPPDIDLSAPVANGYPQTTFSANASFTCTAADYENVIYTGFLRYGWSLTASDTAGVYDRGSSTNSVRAHVSIQCESGPTPTPPPPTRTPPRPTASDAGVQCTGTPFALFNNFNGSAVDSFGSSAPSFNTNGKPYCLTQIETYHWNGGYGMPPGQLWLEGPGGVRVGPYQATGSAGQNGVLANWYVNVPPRVILNGTYTCMDSDSLSWSSNKDSGGQGFCRVWVTNATAP
jgi:hypothetical protein